jgi:uncharacterized protein (TIGR03000 family)
MYSILVTAFMSVGTTAPEFGWLRPARSSCYGCTGCSGCYGCYGMGVYYGPSPAWIAAPPAVAVPVVPVPEVAVPIPPAQLGETVTPPGGTILPPAAPGDTTAPPVLDEAQTSPNQVTVVVTLPADARLLVDGQPLALTGPVRVFRTPPLDPTRDYFYELTMEVERGGRTVRRTQTVWFRAGKVARVEFAEPGPDAAGANTARIRVRVPDGAALYVEGRPWAGQPTIRTPPLDPGRTHYYLLRVEVQRDGRREVRTREVAFRAGQDLTVTFDEPPAANVVKR